jgi:protein-S-isoprenylcysteine O-methyltransferase
LIVSASSAVSALGFALAIKAGSLGGSAWLPGWFRQAIVPGLPFTAWIGVALGVAGLGLRLTAVMTLRERYTKTLLVTSGHTVERRGPYGRVRHPGYLGSLLCLNGTALASANLVVLAASLIVTSAAYAYRIRVEDRMLIAELGQPYVEYRRQVPALIPSLRRAHRSS